MVDAFAQQKIFPYDGQQDSTRHPLLISPKDIVDSNNIVFTNYSTKKKRPGITPAFTDRPSGNRPGLSGIDFWRLGTQRIVYYDGSRIYATTSTGVKDDITGTYSLPSNDSVTFQVFYGLLCIFFGDGTTSPKKWNMTGAISELSADLTAAKFGRPWLNRMWVPDPAVPGRLLGSQTNDPTAYIGGDAVAIDLDINDGDPEGITAIFPPKDGYLYVAKKFSIYRIAVSLDSNGDQIFSPQKISDGIGCISHRAAISVEGAIFFPSDRGVHILESTNQIVGIANTFLSEPIQPVWVNDTNFARSEYMTAVYDYQLNSYLLFFPTTGRSLATDVWGYSLVANKWYRWRDYNQTYAFRYVDFFQKRVRTMVCSSEGDFGYIDVESKNDYGNPISLYVQSGIIAPSGAPDNSYQFEAIAPVFVPQSGGTMSIGYKIDGQTIETLDFSLVANYTGQQLGVDWVMGQSVLGGIPQVKMEKKTMLGQGSFYELFIEHIPSGDDAADQDFELLGLLVDVNPVNKVIGEVNA